MRAVIFLLLFGLLFVAVSGCATNDPSVSEVLTETKTKRQSEVNCPRGTIKACIGPPRECACYKRD